MRIVVVVHRLAAQGQPDSSNVVLGISTRCQCKQRFCLGALAGHLHLEMQPSLVRRISRHHLTSHKGDRTGRRDSDRKSRRTRNRKGGRASSEPSVVIEVAMFKSKEAPTLVAGRSMVSFPARSQPVDEAAHTLNPKRQT